MDALESLRQCVVWRYQNVRGVRMAHWLRFLSLFSYPSVLCGFVSVVWYGLNVVTVWIELCQWCCMDSIRWICCLFPDFHPVCGFGSDFVECGPITGSIHSVVAKSDDINLQSVHCLIFVILFVFSQSLMFICLDSTNFPKFRTTKSQHRPWSALRK